MFEITKLFGVLLIICLVSESIWGEAIDWCDKQKWCEYATGPHIKCNNNGKFAPECPKEVEMIKINKGMRMEILAYHNRYRNLIASGKLDGYEPALRMGQMCYCHDLERMAELNVKTCQFEHDACRSTEKYHYSGQNLYQWYSNMKPKNQNKILLSGITKWFEEYQLANMSLVDKYQRVEAKIGHFTAMVNSANRCVGCAALKMFKDGFHFLLFACNYASTNMLNRPVYRSGKPGSKCKTGMSKKYPALCSTREVYGLYDYEDYENDI